MIETGHNIMDDKRSFESDDLDGDICEISSIGDCVPMNHVKTERTEHSISPEIDTEEQSMQQYEPKPSFTHAFDGFGEPEAAESNDATPIRTIGFHEMDSALDDDQRSEGGDGQSDSSLSDDERSVGTTGYPDGGGSPRNSAMKDPLVPETAAFDTDLLGVGGATSPQSQDSSGERIRRASSLRATASLRANIAEDDDFGDPKDYRVYDDEDLDPDFQGGAKKKLGESPKKKNKKGEKENEVAENESVELDELNNGISQTSEESIIHRSELSMLAKESTKSKIGKSEPGTTPSKADSLDIPEESLLEESPSPEAVMLDDEDDIGTATTTKKQKVQMQLRFKCLDKTCTKKFITKIALNTHCKKSHPDLMKQRALKERAARLAEAAARNKATAAARSQAPASGPLVPSPLRGSTMSPPRPMSGFPTPMTNTRPANPFSQFNRPSFGTSTTATFMNRFPTSTNNRFPSSSSNGFSTFTSNGTRPGMSSAYPTTSSGPTYASLKSLITGNSSFPSGTTNAISPSRYPYSGPRPAFGLPSSPFGSPMSPPGMSKALVPASSALVPSPTKSFGGSPYANFGVTSTPRPPGWLGPNSIRAGMNAYGTMAGSPSTGGVPRPMGTNQRFTRVHASQYLNGPNVTGRGVRPVLPTRLGSPTSKESNGNSKSGHKCRFISCAGKSFLTERALLSHIAKHHDKSRKGTSPLTSPVASPSKPKLKCTECGAEFLTQEGLDRHNKRVHVKKPDNSATIKLERDFAMDPRQQNRRLPSCSSADGSVVGAEPKREARDIDFDDDDDFNLDDIKFDFLDEEEETALAAGETATVGVEAGAAKSSDVKPNISKQVETSVQVSKEVLSNFGSASGADIGSAEATVEGRLKGEAADEEADEEEEEEEEQEEEQQEEQPVEDKLKGEAEIEDNDDEDVEHLEEEEITDYNSFADQYVFEVGLKPCYVPLEKLDIPADYVPNFSRIIKQRQTMKKGQTKFRASPKKM